MKKFMFAVLTVLCIYLVSCNDTSTSSGSSNADSTAAKYKQINRDVLKGIETGDTTKFTAIADDAIDHADPKGDVTNGDSIKWFLSNMHNQITDLKIEVHGEVVDGDYLYCWSTMSGTAKENNFMGLPIGKVFSFKGVDVVRFKDGKMAEHWAYMDPRDMMSMGPQPQPMNNMSSDTTKKK